MRRSLLPLLLLAGCIPYHSTAFYTSAGVADRPFFGVEPGRDHVFEVCRQWSAPVPDAAAGYCFELRVDPALVRPGSEVPIPGPGVQPFLWKLRGAPRFDSSRRAQGRLRIREVYGSYIVADLDVRDDSIPGGWRLQGTRAFRRRSVPARAAGLADSASRPVASDVSIR